MKTRNRRVTGILLGLVLPFSSNAAVLGSQPIPNWPAPPSWTASRAAGLRPLGIESDIAGPLPFIPITPCRQYDSRSASPLAQGVNRAVLLTGAPCGIPTGAAAVSVNITVFNITGATGNGVFKVDTVTPPAVAWINYPPTEAQRGNAGVLALNGSGQIIVQVAQGAGQVDLTCDVNGYYAAAAANQGNTFKVINSGGATTPAISGETTSTSTNATGVYGVASAATGITDGVWGRNFSNSDFSAGVLGISEGTSGLTFGVFSRTNSTSDGAVGVYGEAIGGSGTNFGVEGMTLSSDGAGVYGIGLGGDSDPFLPLFGAFGVGVRGASSDSQGVEGFSTNSYGVVGHHAAQSTGILGYDSIFGVYSIGNIGATGVKPFIDPHPTDPTKAVAYVALEGPEAGTYFRGRGKIHNGAGVIVVPESFRLVTDEEGLTVQITPIGQAANVAVISADLNSVLVRSSVRDLEFYYAVNGVRKNFKEWSPIVENTFYVPQGPNARMPGAFSAEQRRVLVANGTYNEDGTVNMGTADRLGWTKAWAERETMTRQQAEKAREAAADRIR